MVAIVDGPGQRYLEAASVECRLFQGLITQRFRQFNERVGDLEQQSRRLIDTFFPANYAFSISFMTE